MMTFLKRNYALVAGIALPLLLVAAFFVSGKALVVDVPDPRFDAVVATNYSHRADCPYRIGIDDGRLYIRVRTPAQPDRCRQVPVIYVFEHATLYARKVDIDFYNVVDGKVVDPELDALNRDRIVPHPVSADGYTFERAQRGDSGLFAALFGGGRAHRGNYVLKKAGRSVPVVGPQPIYSAEFIGWRGK